MLILICDREQDSVTSLNQNGFNTVYVMRHNLLLLTRKVLSKLPVILFDVLAIPVAWYGAYWLRYNMHPYPSMLVSMHSYIALGLLTVVQIACYYYFKIYRGLWRFSSLNDVMRILKATTAAMVLVIPVFYATSILQHLSRSVFPLYCIMLACILCGGRLFIRHQWDNKGKSRYVAETNRVLIVGAGLA